jgi:hypothetical protein
VASAGKFDEMLRRLIGCAAAGRVVVGLAIGPKLFRQAGRFDFQGPLFLESECRRAEPGQIGDVGTDLEVVGGIRQLGRGAKQRRRIR